MSATNSTQATTKKSPTVWTRQVVKQVDAPQSAGDLKWMLSRENVGGQQKWFASAALIIGTPTPGQPPQRLTTKVLLSDEEAARVEAVLATLFDSHTAQLQAAFQAQS